MNDDSQAPTPVVSVTPGVEPAEPAGPSGGVWAIPLLCAGLALIACCLLIPAADANRRLAWEQEKLKRDAAFVTEMVAASQDFLVRFGTDEALSERLAVRQLRLVPEGSASLDVAGSDVPFAASPFALVRVEPPEPMPVYQPVGGRLTELCLRDDARLLMTAAGLMLVAVGLITGTNPPPPKSTLADAPELEELPGHAVPFE
ncbi:MAG: hypothetical protein ACFCVE_10400 [Phycisphaerae bacterium]